jgi:hypothetical protein
MAGAIPLKLRLSIRLPFIENMLTIVSDDCDEDLHGDHR